MKAGTLVVIGEHESRGGRAPVMHQTIACVEQVVYMGPGIEPMVLVKPLRHFCWVYGYPELGRRLPATRAAAALSECRPLFTFEEVL